MYSKCGTQWAPVMVNEITLPAWLRARTGMSPMQVARATLACAVLNLSLQDLMLIRRERSGVMLPVQPKSGCTSMNSDRSCVAAVQILTPVRETPPLARQGE